MKITRTACLVIASLVLAGGAVADSLTEYVWGWDAGFTCWWYNGNTQVCTQCCLAANYTHGTNSHFLAGCYNGCDGVFMPPPAED